MKTIFICDYPKLLKIYLKPQKNIFTFLYSYKNVKQNNHNDKLLCSFWQQYIFKVKPLTNIFKVFLLTSLHYRIEKKSETDIEPIQFWLRRHWGKRETFIANQVLFHNSYNQKNVVLCRMRKSES